MAVTNPTNTERTDGVAARDAPLSGDGVVSAEDRLHYEGDLEVAPPDPGEMDEEVVMGAYRTMLLSRRLDEKMLTMLKQGRGHFHIGCSGHEAAQMGAGLHLRPGFDRIVPYYRDLCVSLAMGETAEDIMLSHLAKQDDPNSAGRQMPEHYSRPELGIFSGCSAVGSQFLPALGFGISLQRREDDGVVYCSSGEGATSQGAFHEALNWAARERLPMLFFVQDNRYAISVPREEQTAGGSVYKVVEGFDGLARARFDGTDFFTSYAVAEAAIDRIRRGEGPVCLVPEVVRLLPHSSSDNHEKYRSQEELQADRRVDPIDRMEERLIESGLADRDRLEAIREELDEEIDRAARWAAEQDDPDPSEATRFVFSEKPDELSYREEPESAGEQIVMVDAINHALREEMAHDERVLVYGEDVADEKGGVFTATQGLTREFGGDRCFNSPLSENSIVGTAVGLSADGYRPVVEIQFGDYVWPAMQQLRNQVPTLRYRSHGGWSCPMVIRVPVGGYIHGGLCHSQNIESIFSSTPGYRIAMPSNAADAKGLLKTAVRSDDPVLFLEHKALYRQGVARAPEPDAGFLLPFGRARVVREGEDVSVITYGTQVYKALNVARKLEKQQDRSVEVVDVRTMVPLDRETILASVRNTNRVLVLHEDHEFMGFGAEISAQIADDAFRYLDAPVRRVGGAFSPTPFAEKLENAVLPQDEEIYDELRELLAY